MQQRKNNESICRHELGRKEEKKEESGLGERGPIVFEKNNYSTKNEERV